MDTKQPTRLRAIADWITDLPGEPRVSVSPLQVTLHPRTITEYDQLLAVADWSPVETGTYASWRSAEVPEVGRVALFTRTEAEGDAA